MRAGIGPVLAWCAVAAARGATGAPAALAQADPPGGGVEVLALRSPHFEAGRAIPPEHTCEGRDVSPPLQWSGLPPGTKSLALVVEDPDAPDPAAPKRIWVHWVVYDLPPAAAGLTAGASPRGLPEGAHEGKNDWHQVGYGGPCPPVGRHRYFHRLYALDTVLGDAGPLTKAALEKRIEGHVLAQTELVGTYEKQTR